MGQCSSLTPQALGGTLTGAHCGRTLCESPQEKECLCVVAALVIDAGLTPAVACAEDTARDASVISLN
ncbi:unnamed protein product [Gadus morhua 'NCC']